MEKRYISAGAGSGKTYKVTTTVAELIRDKKLKPQQVIMTTFTKAAAQELREKAKKELANLGLYDEAQQMEHALIGTVHSVANNFLTKYWYLLGILPDAAAMEEDELETYRDHSLRGLLNDKQRNFLYNFTETYQIGYGATERKAGLNYEFWKANLCTVLDYMQWYGITDEQLDNSLGTTKGFLQCLLPDKAMSLKAVLTDGFYKEVEDFFGKATRKMGNNQQRAKNFYYSHRYIDAVTDETVDQFIDSLKKVKVAGTVLEGPATEKVKQSLMETKLFTEQNVKNLSEYASIIFSLAKQWRRMYRAYKDEHHLIDFNDMEVMFLQLLDVPEVQQDIRSSYTHLFVDEFQDSNPMQVQIFQKLSTLLNACYVGDKKQAIYGFRGSDTELTAAVADSIKDRETLEHSYRSVEPLVNFSNTLFTQVFKELGEKEVVLSMPKSKEKGNRSQIERPLRLWKDVGDIAMAQQIQQLILREQIAPKDVAVLARTNSELDKLAEELRLLHVPVYREEEDIQTSRTGRLMKALLTLIATPSNQLARAEVAYLTVPGCNITKIIEERLDYLKQEAGRNAYLADVPILKRLNELRHFKSEQDQEFSRNLLGFQSINAMIESLVIELDLYSVVQGWEDAAAEQTNLQVFIDLARQYEENSTKLARPATVTGFIDYFTNQRQTGAANEEGVRLYTYHKAKGLEWKVVILLSLGNNVNDATRIATLSVLGCHNHREQLPTAEVPNPPMSISLVYNIWGKSNEEKNVVTARLQNHPLWESICKREIDEAARLLYVGVTRARDILILAPKWKKGTIDLNWFRSVGMGNVAQTLDDTADRVDLFHNGIEFDVEEMDRENLLEWQTQRPMKTHHFEGNYSPLNHNRNLSPSQAGKTPHDTVPINQMERRMEVRNRKEEEALMGDFIHQVFCCCSDGISVERIIALRDSYGFSAENLPEPERVLDAWRYLMEVLQQRYGAAIRHHHETPFRLIDKEGRYVSGYIDFVWETEEGYVIVDYKTCPGNYNLVFKPESEHYAGRHGDQLDCYQQALEATGTKKVLARIIYYPVTQFVAEVL